MKKIIAVIFIAMLIAGCATSGQQSDFWQRDSVYSDKSWDHTFFSWFGYKSPEPTDAEKTEQQGWWGATYEVQK